MRAMAAIALALLLAMAPGAGEWLQEELTFGELGFPTKIYRCTSEDRELVTEVTIPFTIPERPVSTTLGIHASSTYAPELKISVNGVTIPGERTYSEYYTVRSGFDERWNLDTYDYNLKKGENTLTLRVIQRLGYCEDITLFENSFVLVRYETEPTPSPTATPSPSPSPWPTDEPTATPTATPVPSQGPGGFEVGSPCSADGECTSGNCNVVCCLGGYTCCDRDAHCHPDERCDTDRSYCVPRGSMVDGFLDVKDIMEAGLFFAALIVGVWYFLRARD